MKGYRNCWPWAHIWNTYFKWNIPYRKCTICGKTQVRLDYYRA